MAYMAKLGGYSFKLETAAFQSLSRQTNYRWELKNRLKRKPAHQFLGPGEDTITLPGYILPHFRGGIGQVGAMRAEAANGEPLPLIYAFENVGQYCGLWVIKEIKETRTLFFKDGVPRRIEFDLTIADYGEDGTGSASGGGGLFGSLLGGSIPGALEAMGGSLSPLQALANSLPVITPDSVLEAVHQVGGFVSEVSSNINALADAAVAGISSVAAELVSAMPPEAVSAIRDVSLAAAYVEQVHAEVSAAIEVGRSIPSAVKAAGAELQQGMTTVLPIIDSASASLATAERATLSIARSASPADAPGWTAQAAGISRIAETASDLRTHISEAANYAAQAVETINV